MRKISFILCVIYTMNAFSHGDLHLRIEKLKARISTELKKSDEVLQLAELYCLDKNWKLSEKYFFLAKKITPLDLNYQIGLANMYYQNKKYIKAKEQIDQFLEKSVALRYNAFLLKARISKSLRSFELAENYYNQAIEKMDNFNPDVFQEKLEVQKKLNKDLVVVQKYLESAIEKYNDISLKFMEIEYNTLKHDWKKALSRMDQVIAESNRKELYYFKKAKILELNSDFKLAIENYGLAKKEIDKLPERLKQNIDVKNLEKEINLKLNK